MFGANTAFSALDLLGNIRSAQLNKDQAGPVEGLMQQALGKKKGSLVYGTVELATAVVGSGKAITSLADKGYLIQTASKESVVDAYRNWSAIDGRVTGLKMAGYTASSNIQMMLRPVSVSNNGHVLPQLTEVARESKWSAGLHGLGAYGEAGAEEFGKKYVNDKIDDEITDPVAKSFPTLGGKVIFRSGIKAFEKHGDNAFIDTIEGEK
ncbi:hypothetical protein FD51_GL001181 [Lacticaseibacillus zeae DSM 20178 = KCTC 3804]|uniref:Uncharacterized protein n=2 Tax=Lacticaseibacillus zeae TaxID=57037 RepID=A0A5R8LXS8_LACZE|nr:MULTISPECIES: hypothetical protein [Lacticaseibacillus]KRK11225.1 hypothetical protein FD51_GL001181 [Lacticaseibacillus zeae DSM 20178 = KCTC 3804]MDE3283908.1 hypothetical protein [Lacticaseibacillus casei]OLS09951.1 hypothetical protein AUQ39_04805 [Lacticaseibacillus casei]QVI31410.1 hypothetical protein KG087_10855 [Lacticaseibacillus zeae]TLF42181.1 hypothetical protein FEI14_07800 [Lacticaseibacillus zeae]